MNVVTHDIVTNSRTLHRPSAAGWTGLSASIARVVGLWRTRTRERRVLAALDHRDLRDLGLSRWEVERELAKPFWRG
jgi:uncharacterized protein YjiS (DUF1127 family)